MAKKANPRIVVYLFCEWWHVSVELAGDDLWFCDRGEGAKTWATKRSALKAAERLRDRLSRDWSAVDIEVE